MSMVGLPPGGATCPGGKINWDTGITPVLLNGRPRMAAMICVAEFAQHFYLNTHCIFSFLHSL